MENKKFKVFRLLILFAISLSFLFLPFEIKTCAHSPERIGPIVKNGKIVGIRIYAFVHNHFFKYIGIKKNDTITAVNDIEVSKVYQNEKLRERIITEIRDYNHTKLKLKRKKSTYTIEFVLNPKNISKIERSLCNDIGSIDQSITKKEMFDFYEIRKIE